MKMETPQETEKVSEKLIQEIMSVVHTVPWEWGYDFTFQGIHINIIVTPSEDLVDAKEDGTLGRFGKSAEFFRSPNNVSWDIYLHGTIPKTERPRVLFHELVEIKMIEEDFSSDEAHSIALREEIKKFGPRKLDLSII